MIRTHSGQHGPDCFGCKINSLTFGVNITSPATHNSRFKDDPWTNNPVVERMQELSGQTIDTDALNKKRVDLQQEYS